MKNLKKKRLLFTFGMVVFLLYACVREEFTTDEQQELSSELAVGKNRELTVAAAKEWKKGKYEVVEASLRSNMNVMLYDQDTNEQRKKMNKKETGRVMNVARTFILCCCTKNIFG